MPVPVSSEVAREMFEDAPPGSPELDKATQAWANALAREYLMQPSDEDDE